MAQERPAPPAAAPPPDGLPVLACLPSLRRVLRDEGAAVLVAPPGTGKSTGVPPALLSEPWVGDGRIVVLEPRRMAARAVATRMAAVHGGRVGETFGFAVRHERRVGPRTRVEVVTEGLLTRRLQDDPALEGVAGVLLDEFHERSVDADLALALLVDARASLRPDLRLVAMSATLDAGPVADLLGAPVVSVDAPMHLVRTLHRPGDARVPLERRVAPVVLEALHDHDGDVLVFLPGRGEIARVARELAGRVGAGVEVCELHGSVRAEEQDRLLSPHADRRRRVILATSIAETSVTVPGVRVVVDAGRRRTGEVDPRTGLPGLVTRSVSLAGADQRRGRAGREAPGACYRLWSPNDEAHRARHDPPEIEVADLAPLVLQTLAWGASSPRELRWVDPPPDHAVRRAMGLLADLDAVDLDAVDLDAVDLDAVDAATGRLTRHGRRLSAMGLHPRLGAIAAAGAELGVPRLAAQVAAVLEVGGPGEVDLAERVRLLRRGRAPAEVTRVARSTVDRLGVRPRSGAPRDREVADEDLDRLVARLALAGFADRLAMRRRGRTDARGRERTVWQLRHGGEVEGEIDGGEWIVACGLDAQPGEGRPGRLHLAVVPDRADVAEVLRRHAAEERSVTWDPTAEPAWAATVTTRLDAIRVATRPWREPDDAAVAAAAAAALAAHGPSILARWTEADRLRSRVAFARARGIPSPAGGWPDLSEAALSATTGEWLAPVVAGARGPAALARVDVRGALVARVGWEGMQALEVEVPESWEAPGGRHLPLRYGAIDGDPGSVLLSVRLQALLGIDEHPCIGRAHIPVTVEPLSPAGRPVQRTEDLPGFWRGSYAQVRAEMRARYRKHDWPERPWETAG